MSTLMEKIKKFFEGWCPYGSKETGRPAFGQEKKPQQEEPQPKADQPKKKPEQQPGS